MKSCWSNGMNGRGKIGDLVWFLVIEEIVQFCHESVT
jgi:hypothetical protein